ncbi:MAG: hypothetical protein OXU67_07660 [Chloroflexota bacterium]|nr:hypothetical protein [Chloroflexota bacterium]
MVVQNIEQERISRLEGTYEQVDRRLDDMNTRLGETNRSIEGLRAEMNTRFEEMNNRMDSRFEEMNSRMDSRFGELNNRYNTLVMLMIASWVTVIAALIALFFK